MRFTMKPRDGYYAVAVCVLGLAGMSVVVLVDSPFNFIGAAVLVAAQVSVLVLQDKRIRRRRPQ